MPDVFISYSTQDQWVADRVLGRLSALNVSAFLAPLSIQPGLRWKEAILGALRESRIVLFLASRAACASSAVMHDLGAALYGEKEIVPVCWDISPGDLPEWVRDRQAVVVTPQDPLALDRTLEAIGERVRSDKSTNGLLLLGALGAVVWAFSSDDKRKR